MCVEGGERGEMCGGGGEGRDDFSHSTTFSHNQQT